MYIFHFVVARLFKIGLILNKYIVFVFFSIDYDTDEETDKLLGFEHQVNKKNQAIGNAVSKPSRPREGRLNNLNR